MLFHDRNSYLNTWAIKKELRLFSYCFLMHNAYICQNPNNIVGINSAKCQPKYKNKLKKTKTLEYQWTPKWKLPCPFTSFAYPSTSPMPRQFTLAFPCQHRLLHQQVTTRHIHKTPERKENKDQINTSCYTYTLRLPYLLHASLGFSIQQMLLHFLSALSFYCLLRNQVVWLTTSN